MKRFSISDIESLTGIKAHTIRVWEQRYNFFTPKRSETNIRYYSDDDLCTFLNIATLSDNGYKISKISKMSSEEIISLVKELQSNHLDSHIQIQMLSNAMVKLDETEFENIINTCIDDIGLEKSMQEVIFPFMRKVGIMWQIGSINPAHEHFATHKIEQKIIEATYKIPFKIKPSSKKYVLFLPPNEQHELGLLFAQYLLRKHEQQCLYLGQNLPYQTLAETVEYYQPDFVFTVLTSSSSEDKPSFVLERIKKAIGNVPLFITGGQAIALQPTEDGNTHIIKDILSFINLISGK